MFYSLRWVGLLFACAFMAAVASMAVQFVQTKKETVLMAEPLTNGDARLGKADMTRYRCGACHSISGVPDATGSAGPALKGIAIRKTIAGRLSNTPENLEAWLIHPHEIDPAGGMPDLGVTKRDSRDMAAFLYTRR